jgi:hypothetical protein
LDDSHVTFHFFECHAAECLGAKINADGPTHPRILHWDSLPGLLLPFLITA